MMRTELNAHYMRIEEVSKTLETSLEKGLTEEEAKNRLETYGYNELIQQQKVSALKIFANQFKDFLVYLLFFAIVISFIVGLYELSKGETPTAFLDAFVILIILIVNAILGFYQEYHAEKALESLKKMAPHNAKVKREGYIKEIEVKDVAVGDIIQLDGGDKVPADARLIKAFSLYADESTLTGESAPVHKNLELVSENTTLADRKNMVHSHSVITRGNAEAIVIYTGMNTEIGKIAEKVQIPEEPSPFQLEVARFGKKLGIVIMLVCSIVFIFELIYILTFSSGTGQNTTEEIINSLTIAISLAVSAVPEGLVVVITVVMSIGMKRMANRNALVKTLNVVETLGRVNVICTDKTGTLTKNEMTVVRIFLGEKEFKVEGTGYALEGKIVDEAGKSLSINSGLERFLGVCMFCNNSNVRLKNDGTRNTHIIGDPTEISLKVLAMKMELDIKVEKIHEIPFDSDRKMMSVVIKTDNKLYALIKGAPDVLLKNATRCLQNGVEKIFNGKDKSDKIRLTIKDKNKEFARNGLRVLGIAYKPLDENYKEEDIEREYTYLGLVGIIDPARDEVKDSIEEARRAGIRTIMITGDHKITAIAIAKQIGLTENEESITGARLDELTDEELTNQLKTVNIFARVTSEHKLRILNVLKKDGLIVSMTGDGVNDAPALKGANVGLAMGITGTKVSQEAADIILLDDNYATILNAIEEGRGIYNATKNFFRYMLSVNFSEIFLLLTAWVLMKLFVNIYLAQPLEPIQILWLNIATDGIPAMVLGLSPTDPEVMKAPPRKDFNIIKDIKYAMLFTALIATISSIILYIVTWTILIPMWSNPHSPYYDPRFIEGTVIFGVEYSAREYQIGVAQTIVFTSVVFFELFFVFSCASEYKPMWKFPNKHLFWATGVSFGLHLLILFTPLCIAFHAVPMDRWFFWIAILLGSILIIPAEETRKYLKKRRYLNQNMEYINL